MTLNSGNSDAPCVKSSYVQYPILKPAFVVRTYLVGKGVIAFYTAKKILVDICISALAVVIFHNEAGEFH